MGSDKTKLDTVLRGRLVRLAITASIVLSTFVGTIAISAIDSAPAAAYPVGPGYWLAASDGGIFSFGQAQFYGSTGGITLNKPIVAAAPYPFLEGYWLVASDGGVFSFGSARFFGSMGGKPLNKPIVGITPTPSGLGYWLVASDGGIFSFGDAKFHGSTGGMTLNKPIVGMAATPDGGGYWLVASDGGIFSFGDAKFYGSTGAMKLNKPIVGMSPTPTGAGYWLVASDGGIFSFGNAKFFGSTGAMTLNKPIIGMMVRPPLAVKVDAYVSNSSENSNWVDTPSGWQLQLNNNAGGSVPAGARVLGVAGLNVSQLQTLGFTVASGTCSVNEPYFLLTATNPTTKATDTRAYTCLNGGGGASPTFNPVTGAPGAAPLPANDVVASLDIVDSGTSTALTNIQAAGITVTDYRTFTAAGTAIG